MDSKYVVVKRDDAAHLKVNVPGGSLLDCIMFGNAVLEDAVVIRTQDVFAASGLYAYANTIYAHVELLKLDLSRRGITARHQDRDAFDMLDRLFEIANYFHTRADEAESNINEGRCKVPD